MRKLFQRTPLRLINYVYWFLLAYMVAALAWWYIELVQMNDLLLVMHQQLLKAEMTDKAALERVMDEHQRNSRQYIGEGLTFFVITILVAVFVYITVRKQIRYHLQQKNFMMAVTHELKTPIAVTKLSLETLRRHKLDPERQHKMLGDAINETERLNTLCNNILLSSQLESGGYKINMHEFNCTDMVDQAVAQFRKRYPERDFQWKPACECYVRGEEFLIGLVLNNLLENAIKYTPPSSPVMVSITETDHDCIIGVADLGAGIPDHEKSKVFEKFYRMEDESRRKAKGTGLGLYLSQRIIHDHHGKMLLVNNQPSGSVFSVILPKSSL